MKIANFTLMFLLSMSYIFAQPQLEIEHNNLGFSSPGIQVINLHASGYGGIFEGGVMGVRGNSDSGVGVEGRSTSSDGIRGHSSSRYGVWGVSSSSAGGYFRSLSGNIDLILGGTQILGDDGIIGSEPSLSSSDLVLRSNDEIVLQLDYDNTESGSFKIRNGVSNNVFNVNESGDLDMDGTLTSLRGIFSRNNNDLPDVELGGTSTSADNGVISSSTTLPSSDLILKSNDDVAIHLNENQDAESGHFIVENANNAAIFDLDEQGNLDLSGGLDLGGGLDINTTTMFGLDVETTQTIALSAFSGNLIAGLFSSGDNSVADIMLGGTSAASDNGIISTGTGYPSSDLILKANDDVAIHLDDNNDEAGRFVVENGVSNIVFDLSESGNLSIDGSLSQGSDRNRKEEIIALDNREILSKIAFLPIYEWQYKEEDRRHIGPMAQDFHAAFGLGDDDTSISSLDADGVALAAIQALYQLVEKQAIELEELKREIKQLKRNQD